jgi:hypothetical protein
MGLFMGKTILDEVWPSIVRWIGEPMLVASPNVGVSPIECVQ